MEIKSILKDYAYQNLPLPYDLAYELGTAAVAACRDGADPLLRVQTIVALSALHNRAVYAAPGAAEQIAGVCAAIFQDDIAKSEFGFAQPMVPYAMDNCGMGGDLFVTANVSTLAALVAATDGIPMCKHGSPANADEGKHGSSDFIELLGLEPFCSRDRLERSVERHSFGYSEALDTRFKLIHRQTHEFAKLPHMNDLIGPITNPVDPKVMSRRVLGVNHLVAPETVAEAYHIMNQKGVTNMEHMLIVRGFVSREDPGGFDELSICEGGTRMAELRDGQIKTSYFGPEAFGLQPVSAKSISPPRGMSKGDFSLAILHGEIGGPPLQMVLANAALLYVLAGKAKSVREGYEAATDTFASGKVPAVAESVRALPVAA